MAYKLKGINQDSEVCEICGKTGLAKVMWLDQLDADGNETGNVIAVGTTCGAKLLGLHVKGSVAKTEQAISELAYNMVKKEIDRILQTELVNYQMSGHMILRGGFGGRIAKGKITLDEAKAERNRVWPILDYTAGKITIEEALRYV